MNITKSKLKQIIKEELAALEASAEADTHRETVVQASGVLTSKMYSLVDKAYNLAEELNLESDALRELFLSAGAELQNMKSPSDNPVTKLVIEQLKFLVQPGVLITRVGEAMTAFDE